MNWASTTWQISSHPLQCVDRGEIRCLRAGASFMQLVRHQHIEVSLPLPPAASPGQAAVILSRAQRAHPRLSWAKRFACNEQAPTATPVTIKLFGIPEAFATSLGLASDYPGKRDAGRASLD